MFFSKEKVLHIFKSINNSILHYSCSSIAEAVRRGMLYLIPFVFLGALATLLMGIPIKIYQDFISNFAGGVFQYALSALKLATFGFFSVYVTITISLCYAQTQTRKVTYIYGAPFTSLMCLLFCRSFPEPIINLAYLGMDGVLFAILASITIAPIYTFFATLFKTKIKIYSDGVDSEFNSMLFVILPMAITLLIFVVVDWFIGVICGVDTAAALFHTVSSLSSPYKFPKMSAFFSGLFEALGFNEGSIYNDFSDMLSTSGLTDKVFSMAKTLELYTNMGGKGNSLALLIALLLAGKRKTTKQFARVCLIPVIFNISEVIILGIPVIFNPILMVPYIIVNVFSNIIAKTFITLGFVPYIKSVFYWSVPVGANAFFATHSVFSILLQVLLLSMSIAIYMPFIKWWEKSRVMDIKETYNDLLNVLRRSELEQLPIILIKLRNEQGHLARILQYDLMDAIESRKVDIWYQPQVNPAGVTIGVEALFRWEHQDLGFIYPPLALELAKEGDFFRFG